MKRDIRQIIDDYWACAYQQGLDHREHDDREGTAQRLENELLVALSAAEKLAEKYRLEMIRCGEGWDTALRERDEAREHRDSLGEENANLLSKRRGPNGAAYAHLMRQRDDALGVLADTLKYNAQFSTIFKTIKTALGCPDLPVEELAGKVGEVVKYAEELANENCPVVIHANGYKMGYAEGRESMRLAAANNMRRFFDSPRRGDIAASVIMDIPIHPKEGE